MKIRQLTACGAIIGTTLVGCTPSEQLVPSDGHTSPSHSALQFNRHPGLYDNQSIGNCIDDVNSWVSDSAPVDTRTGRVARFLDTIGIAEKYMPDGSPQRLIAGATIKGLGGATVEIATSDDSPGVTQVVNLSKRSYSVVLKGGKGYDVAFSAREEHDADGSIFPSFQLNCLPNFDYYGNETPVPLSPSMIVPPSEPITVT